MRMARLAAVLAAASLSAVHLPAMSAPEELYTWAIEKKALISELTITAGDVLTLPYHIVLTPTLIEPAFAPTGDSCVQVSDTYTSPVSTKWGPFEVCGPDPTTISIVFQFYDFSTPGDYDFDNTASFEGSNVPEVTGSDDARIRVHVMPAPEPGTLALLGLGLAGLAATRRRKQ